MPLRRTRIRMGCSAVVAHKSANHPAVKRHGFIVECQKMVPGLILGGRARFQQQRRLPASSSLEICVAKVDNLRGGCRACIETDLCRGPVFAVVAIGYTQPERDTVKPVELREVTRHDQSAAFGARPRRPRLAVAAISRSGRRPCKTDFLQSKNSNANAPRHPGKGQTVHDAGI